MSKSEGHVGNLQATGDAGVISIEERARSEIRQMLAPYEQNVLMLLRTKPNFIGDKLLSLRLEILRNGAQLPSVPALCAQFIMENFLTPQKGLALEEREAGNEGAFVFWQDVVYGANETLGRIFLAERAIAGVAKPLQDGSRAGQLLIGDSSGFTLLADYIAQLKETQFSPHLIGKFVVAGAEFAQRIYQALYKIATELPRPS